MRSVDCTIILLITLAAGCGPHAFSGVPAPDTLLHCFTLSEADSSARRSGPPPQVPRAINLGTTSKGRLGRSPLYVGTVTPNPDDLRALWRLTPPDSLIIDLVPASTGMPLFMGTTLRTRISDTLLEGKAIFWSDEVGSEHAIPIIGKRVTCPAGA